MIHPEIQYSKREIKGFKCDIQKTQQTKQTTNTTPPPKETKHQNFLCIFFSVLIF